MNRFLVFAVFLVASYVQNGQAAKDLATGSLSITDPPISTGLVCATTSSVTFSLDICDIGGEGGEITAVNFYYVIGADYVSGTSTASAALDAGKTASVAAGMTHSYTRQTIAITLPNDCATNTYTYFCVVITVTDDAVTTNDDSCIILALNADSTTGCSGKDCSALTAPTHGSLSSTVVTSGTTVTLTCDADYTEDGTDTITTCNNAAWTYTLSSCVAALSFTAGTFAVSGPASPVFSRTTAVTITFDAGLTNGGPTAVTITSYKLYLSDNDDLSAGGAKLSTAIDVTGSPVSSAVRDDGTSGNGLTTDMTADVLITNADDCATYNRVCLQVAPGDSTICLTFTDIGATADCSALSFTARTFTVSGPASPAFSRTTAVTITFDAGLTNVDASAITITSYKLYLSDSDDLSASGAKVSAAIDVTGSPTSSAVDDDGTANNGLTTGMTADVLITNADDCSAYDRICLQVVPGDSTICVTFVAISATVDCSGLTVKDASFTITSPDTYTFSRDSATEIIFDAGLENTGTSLITITSVKLYLSDSADLSATDAKVSDAIDVTGAPTEVAVDADGTDGKGLTTEMTALVQIVNADDCSSYDKLCLKVEPTAATQCIDITDKTDCTEGSGVKDVAGNILNLVLASSLAIFVFVI